MVNTELGSYYDSASDDDIFDPTDASKVAAALANGGEAAAKAFAAALQKGDYLNPATTTLNKDNGYKDTVATGYYLIVDEDLPDGDDAYTSYIIQVVGNVDMKPKSSVPEVDKQVQDNDDGVTFGDNNGWGETADYDINQEFQFKLEAKFAADANFEEYESYALKFNDKMSPGLTFDRIDSVKVYVGGVEKVTLAVDGEAPNVYTTTASAGSQTFEVSIEDLIKILSDGVFGKQEVRVEVLYTAHLNEKAVMAGDGTVANTNEVTLEYSNNPNYGGGGDRGTTPPDTVFVFTYDIPAEKVTTDGGREQPLAGAGFKLYSDPDCTSEIKLAQVDNKDGATWYYIPVKEGGLGVDELTAPTTGDNTGKFDIRGLDIGTYYLKETTTPPGYNTCDPNPITIQIVPKDKDAGEDPDSDENSGHKESTDETSAKTHYYRTTGDITQIVNNKGTTLPETGGIGTTIFYVVGSVLVLGAVILLVTKRRMKG